MTPDAAHAELSALLFAKVVTARERGWDEIVARVRVLVERIQKSQQNEDALTRIINAPEEAERNRK